MVFTELNMVCMVQLGLNLGSIWVKIGENMAYMIFYLSKLPLDDYTGLQNKGVRLVKTHYFFLKYFDTLSPKMTSILAIYVTFFQKLRKTCFY